MLSDWGAIFIFLVIGITFGIGGLVVAYLVSPKKYNYNKLDTYECGVRTEGPTWIRFRVSYFMFALIFLVFDVETIYLYPWAVMFQKLGAFAFVEMVIFILILVIGLWYAWKEGAFQWL